MNGDTLCILLGLIFKYSVQNFASLFMKDTDLYLSCSISDFTKRRPISKKQKHSLCFFVLEVQVENIFLYV